MADNTGIAAAPNSGAQVASDDVDGVHYQRVKMAIGADGVAEFPAILEAGVFELVGINEQVDQNDYGAEVEIALSTGAVSGEILSLTLISTEDKAEGGTVQAPAGRVIFFDASPSVSAGDTAIAAASWPKVIGEIKVLASDWISDANGAIACIKDQPLPFHALSSLFAVWLHEDATSLNDAAGDDEQLEFNFWYRRDS